MLRQSSFVPAEDKYFDSYMTEVWGKKNNVQITVENVGFNDLQPKTSVALESGQGPDVVMFQWNWAHLYSSKLLDVSDVATELEKAGGGFYDIYVADCKVDGVWRSVPFGLLGNAIAYREDIVKDVGASSFPQTWDEIDKLGKQVKQQKNMPYGQAWGHSWADPPTMAYPLLWSFGGQEVDKDGKTVMINSPATVSAVEFAVQWYKDAMTSDMLGWDDASNNQAYLGGRLWATLNGASIYIAAKQQNPDLAKSTNHAPMFKGPNGRFYVAGAFSAAIPAYVKDQSMVKDYVRALVDVKNWEKHLELGEGFTTGAVKIHEKNPIWTKDPKMELYKDPSDYKWPGYPGPASKAAAEAQSKYIVVDMFAKAMTGMAPKDSAAWAEAELKKIYGA
ncbi:MAG: extracellular solute-binding protein [Actinobacteria bacterium]|nr:extracellular solute-binding protein [Actinomycetota bacterium]